MAVIGVTILQKVYGIFVPITEASWLDLKGFMILTDGPSRNECGNINLRMADATCVKLQGVP